MAEENGANLRPPLSSILVWGEKGSGKTWFAANSPYKPILMFDFENSSKVYETHGRFVFKRVDAMGLSWSQFKTMVQDPKVENYHTVVLDTAGEVGDMIKLELFKNPQAEKQSALTWGKVRGEIRWLMKTLLSKVQMVVITSHARNDYAAMTKGQGKKEERINQAFLELVDVSIQLIRDPNQKVPYGIVGSRNRLDFLPPKITPMSWEKLLEYSRKPADWDNLAEGEALTDEEKYIDMGRILEEIGD